ncbi:hypothetical protein B0J17DRAFT_677862 [Rhizoctonia solani]|nr:hypothetical protein B0J17DRAFT_677862 [Rhizoctonia solani]
MLDDFHVVRLNPHSCPILDTLNLCEMIRSIALNYPTVIQWGDMNISAGLHWVGQHNS